MLLQCLLLRVAVMKRAVDVEYLHSVAKHRTRKVVDCPCPHLSDLVQPSELQFTSTLFVVQRSRLYRTVILPHTSTHLIAYSTAN